LDTNAEKPLKTFTIFEKLKNLKISFEVVFFPFLEQFVSGLYRSDYH